MDYDWDEYDDWPECEKKSIIERFCDWLDAVRWWWREYWPAVAAGTLCGWLLELLFYILLYKS